MKTLLLVLLSLSPGFAQTTRLLPVGSLSFPTDLKMYLGLSDAQAGTIMLLNQGYNRVTAEKSMRSAQVRREIAEWTAKDPLDPMELGLRYTELEVIRRELQDELAHTREKILAVLDAAQKARLKALEDAMKLQPVITEAQCQNLLAQPDPIGSRILPVRNGDFTLTPVLLGLPAVNCGVQFIYDPMP